MLFIQIMIFAVLALIWWVFCLLFFTIQPHGNPAVHNAASLMHYLFIYLQSFCLPAFCRNEDLLIQSTADRTLNVHYNLYFNILATVRLINIAARLAEVYPIDL